MKIQGKTNVMLLKIERLMKEGNYESAMGNCK